MRSIGRDDDSENTKTGANLVWALEGYCGEVCRLTEKARQRPAHLESAGAAELTGEALSAAKELEDFKQKSRVRAHEMLDECLAAIDEDAGPAVG